MANFEELSRAVLECNDLYFESNKDDNEKDAMTAKAKAIAAKIREKVSSVFDKLKKVNFNKTIKSKVHKEAFGENSAKVDKLYSDLDKLNVEYISILQSKSTKDAVNSFNEIYFALRDGSISGDAAISKMENELNKINSINEKLLDILEKALNDYKELSKYDHDEDHTLDIMTIKDAIKSVQATINWNKGICKSVGVNIKESADYDDFEEATVAEIVNKAKDTAKNTKDVVKNKTKDVIDTAKEAHEKQVEHDKKLDDIRESLNKANDYLKRAISCGKDKEPKGYKMYLDSAISEINNAKDIESGLSDVDFKNTETVTKIKKISSSISNIVTGYAMMMTAVGAVSSSAKLAVGSASVAGISALLNKKLNKSIKNDDYKIFSDEFNRSMKVINQELKKAQKYGEKLKKKGLIVESAEDLSDIYVSYMEGDISINELNAITESVIDYDIDNLYEEKVNLDVLKTVALVIAGATGIGAIIAKVISEKNIANTIQSHEDLKAINDKIKNTTKDINIAYDLLNDLYARCEKEANDCERLYQLFASKTKKEYDGVKTVRVYMGHDINNIPIYDTHIINQYKTTANPDYDPEKAAKWKTASDNLIKTLNEIDKTKQALTKGIKELSTYYRDLKKIAKKYATTDSSAIERLNKACDDSIAKCEEATKSFAEKVAAIKESTADINDIKLGIFEAFENGEITKEERDNLLSQL